MEAIQAALARADLFVAIGTSGNVYPAAGFVAEARAAGAATLELNLEPSEMVAAFDQARYGPASVAVPDWVDEVLGRRG
jgi:NAD-dependent deacetylase